MPDWGGGEDDERSGLDYWFERWWKGGGGEVRGDVFLVGRWW